MKIDRPERISMLKNVARFLIVVLFAKALVLIVYEYRWYFPADFVESSFLIGKKDIFVGVYRYAFYAHLFTGPIALVGGFLLLVSGGRKRFQAAHRWLGRFVILTILLVLVPSGLVMSINAFAGPIAGWGFAALSVATGYSAAAAFFFARKRKFLLHQVWATRCFVLLCSPILLRLFTGAVLTMNMESEWTYRLSSWGSWIVPIVLLEITSFRKKQFSSRT